MFSIDLQSRVPIYEQLYKKIIELRLKGILKAHDQLPSVRVLAKDIGVNPNTVSKAYQELEREKIIYSLPGRGSFVSDVTDSILKQKTLEDFEKATLDALKAGVTKEELKAHINQIDFK